MEKLALAEDDLRGPAVQVGYVGPGISWISWSLFSISFC